MYEHPSADGPGPLRLDVAGDPDRPLVVVGGELDLATAPALRDRLLAVIDDGAVGITLDLRDVSFVDSSGLGVLVGAHKRLREATGGSLTVVGPQDAVRKVFDITGLGPLFGLGASTT
jgi:anti-sigma B factor antagonist